MVSPAAILRQRDMHTVRPQVAEAMQSQPGARRDKEVRALEDDEDADQGERVRAAPLGGQDARQVHRRGARRRRRNQVRGEGITISETWILFWQILPQIRLL